MAFNTKIKNQCKSESVIDIAWDTFSDYIGEHDLKTPLTLEQFEKVFQVLNKNNQFTNIKSQILHSFQYDCYSWPLVEKNKNAHK